ALFAEGHSVTVIGLGSEDADGVTSSGYRLRVFASREHAECEEEDPGGEASPRWPYNSLNRDFAVAWEVAEGGERLAREGGWPDVIEVPEYKADRKSVV